jgi:signal peptidase I
MANTIEPGGFVTIDHGAYSNGDPVRGDIVMFVPPLIALMPNQLDDQGRPAVKFLKRVVGVPGDTIEIKKSVLFINGEKYPEPYLKEPTAGDFKLVLYKGNIWPLMISGDHVNAAPQLTATPFQLSDDETMQKLLKLPLAKIPAGQYLLMGDNRQDSFDGRAYGLVDRSAILGKAMLR